MPVNSRIILSASDLLQGDHWLTSYALVIENKKIKAIIPKEMIAHHLPATQYSFSGKHYLVPGFIDLHIHGANGFDVMDASLDSLNGIAMTLPSEGVTGFLATTMTAQTDGIDAVMKTLPDAMINVRGASILGVHLEGPFISHKRCGAQSAKYIIDPDINLIKRWQSLSKNAIKLVTLAPELKNSREFIRALHQFDIVASVGHSDATFQETDDAIDAGVSYATHLFNSMRTVHQREPGPILPLLMSKRVMAELILDGYHLHPAMVELAFHMKGLDNIVLVSDAMRAKCLKSGTYDLGGQAVNVVNEKATLADGTLAGSVLRLPDALKRLMQITETSLEKSLALITENPAKVLKLNHRKGSLNTGFDADCVVLDEGLNVVLTVRAGEVIFET